MLSLCHLVMFLCAFVTYIIKILRYYFSCTARRRSTASTGSVATTSQFVCFITKSTAQLLFTKILLHLFSLTTFE